MDGKQLLVFLCMTDKLETTLSFLVDQEQLMLKENLLFQVNVYSILFGATTYLSIKNRLADLNVKSTF